jgi:protein-disulfide isomerase
MAKIDTVRLWTDVQSGACAARVRADLDEGRAAGVEATPTLLVNGLRIPGTRTLPELRAIVGEELSPGWLAELTDP